MLTRPRARLELASPVAIVASPYPACSRTTSSVAIVASLALVVGVGSIGILGALLAAFSIVGLSLGVTSSPRARRYFERRLAQRIRERRDEDRRNALLSSGPVRHQQFCELQALVEEIERHDAAEARRLELQGLLDYFVQLCVGHQRYLQSLRVSAAVDAWAPGDAACTKDRHGIWARRLRHREECVVRLLRIANELDSTDELIRLVAQRVATANLDPLIEREIERRLVEIDEVDEALGQLSA